MGELLEKLGVDWRLLIAQLVNFLVLFFLLKKFLYKPVLDLLERRQQKIADGMRDADAAKGRLAGIEFERKQILHQTEAERQRMLEAAAMDVEELRRQRLQTVANEAEGVLARAKEEAERVHGELLAEVRQELGDLVLAITRKATTNTLTKDAHDKLVEAAMEELKEAKL
jgi:F-type H+-transporting ATPase subunit b